jgi:hypothetical protein
MLISHRLTYFCSVQAGVMSYQQICLLSISSKVIILVFSFCSPQLTWRDIQHLTVLTSKRNSLFDAKGRFHWTMNGVGLEFNHLFGFGVLDAGAMVALAKQWQTVPARYHCEGGSVSETQ